MMGAKQAAFRLHNYAMELESQLLSEHFLEQDITKQSETVINGLIHRLP